MSRLIFCSAAEADYTESLCWYAERSIDAANEFDAELKRSVDEIASTPKRFPRCDDRHRFFLMRRFPFQIIYRVQRDDIVIVAVAHTSRSPDYWANR
jgi:plasmid stabilization system protein ParE